MKVQKEKTGIIALLVLVVASAVIRFCIADFPKTILVYCDEMRYYEMARSFFDGTGLAFRNCPTDYQKVLYSLVLSPLFAVTDGILRVRIISLLNCILMSITIIPLWFALKELRLGLRDRIIISIVTLLFPDMVYSMTMMSEVLYWPIFMVFIYIWIKNMDKQSMILSIASGCLCYLGYLCKEVFIDVFLACVLFELVYPCIEYWNNRKENKKIREIFASRKTSIIHTCIFAITFLAAHFVLKSTVFRGMGNSYDQLGLAAIEPLYNKLFMVYGFLFYLAGVLLSVFIFPILFNVVHYDCLSEKARGLFVLMLSFIILTAATVAYTITVREDLGLARPRIHLRYVTPGLIVIFAIFICALKNVADSKVRTNSEKGLWIGYVLMVLFVTAFFKGFRYIIVDQFSFIWYDKLQQRYGELIAENGDKIFYLCPILVMFVLIIFGGMAFVQYRYQSINSFKAVFISAFIMLCILNNIYGISNIKKAYIKDPDLINEVIKLSDFMKSCDGNVLYLTATGGINEQTRYFDTYFEEMDKAYIVNYESLGISVGDMYISNLNFREATLGAPYDNPQSIHYIIVESSVEFPGVKLDNVREIEDLRNENYSVYENLNPLLLSFSE